MIDRDLSPTASLAREEKAAWRALPYVFIGLTGVVAALTILFLVMRALMASGGSCASGGPYVSARPCPDFIWLMPVAIVGGLLLAGFYVFKRPAAGPSFISLLWPALFLALGWNFLEFGLAPPGGRNAEWGWLVCAIVFAIMGAAPLLFAMWGNPMRYLQRVFWGIDRAPSPALPFGFDVLQSAMRAARTPRSPMRQPSSAPPPDAGDSVVTALERLDALHRNGKLSDAEFAAAKRRVLGGEA